MHLDVMRLAGEMLYKILKAEEHVHKVNFYIRTEVCGRPYLYQTHSIFAGSEVLSNKIFLYCMDNCFLTSLSKRPGSTEVYGLTAAGKRFALQYQPVEEILAFLHDCIVSEFTDWRTPPPEGVVWHRESAATMDSRITDSILHTFGLSQRRRRKADFYPAMGVR